MELAREKTVEMPSSALEESETKEIKSPLSIEPNSSPSDSTRRNGFQRPYSLDQIVAISGHSISAISFYVAVWSALLKPDETDPSSTSPPPSMHSKATINVWMVRYFSDTLMEDLILYPNQIAGMVLFHISVFGLLLAAWVSCERIDPAKPVHEYLPNGWLGVKIDGARWSKTRYCSMCRKSVPGLDHHCTWLHTCIGKSNYAQFFTIACCGFVQFLTQAIFASYWLLWLDVTTISQPGEIGVVITLILSIPCTFMYGVLLGFHIYLYFVGYGTYEWMLRQRRNRRAKASSSALRNVVAKSQEMKVEEESVSASSITIGELTSL
uniref:Palmitoyltransferase n=1 Tax=Albugo laibachii Nc14 TaxID=890382 RepID=F0WG08_9STRA|nr:conserved hypothetical protein [Albugo laibachii Nc14]|eukprot:CCA20142.1 conserved hypothetical protein [Albugo laibachii Nc14]